MSEENLILEVGGSASKATREIDKVISRMQALQNSFAAAVPSIAKFNNELNSIASKADSSIGKLVTSFSKSTSSVDKQTLSAAKAESQMAMYQARLDRAEASSARAKSTLDKLSSSNKKVADDAKWAAEAEQSLSDAISRCVTAGKQTQSSVGLRTVATAPIVKSATASEILGGSLGIEEFMSKMDKTTASTKKVSESVKGLKNETSNFAAPASKASKAIDEIGNSAERVSKKTGSLTSVFGYLRNYILTGIVYKTAGFLADSIKSAMSFTENMNLFSVALGENAEKADQFVNSMQRAFGLDPNNLVKNMGVFYQVSTSMGVTSKNAYTLSENFTKLAEDIASYYNISIESANEKLNAGLVGQTKPLRSIGVIITQNALQQTAYSLGIKESVKNMTEAEKIHLRYITILNQTRNAQGDMARTLNSPMNQMRMLTEQTSQLSRAIGSLFIPILVDVIPYITAFARSLTVLINGLASFVGYQAPKVSNKSYGFGDLSDDADNATSAVGSTSDAVKELKRQVMGFDELNVLTKPTDTSTGGSGGAGGVSDNLGVGDYAGYDNLMDTVNTKTEALTKKMTEFFLKVKSFIPQSAIDNFNAALEKLDKTFDKLNQKVWKGNFFEKWTATVSSNLINTTTDFSIALSGLLGIANGIKDLDLGEVLTGFKDAILGLWSLPIDAGTNLIDFWFGTHFQDSWQQFKKSIMGFDFSKWWNGLWSNVSSTFSNAWNGMIGFFTGTIPAWINSAINWFNKLPYNIGLALAQAVGAIGTFGINAWNWTTTELPKIIGEIINWFYQLPGRIGSSLTNAYNNVVNWGNNLIATASIEIPKFVNSIGYWISSLPDKFYNAGVNAVNAIWNGISSLGSWIWGKVTGIANDIARGFTDGLSNIHFPHINLPHFKIDFDTNAPEAWVWQKMGISGRPNINVKWNATGGIFDSASIIGYGVGEAGKEAIMPLNDKVYSEIAQGINANANKSSHNLSTNGLDTERIIGAIEEMKTAIIKKSFSATLVTNDREIAQSANRGNEGIGRRYGMATN